MCGHELLAFCISTGWTRLMPWWHSLRCVTWTSNREPTQVLYLVKSGKRTLSLPLAIGNQVQNLCVVPRQWGPHTDLYLVKPGKRIMSLPLAIGHQVQHLCVVPRLWGPTQILYLVKSCKRILNLPLAIGNQVQNLCVVPRLWRPHTNFVPGQVWQADPELTIGGR